MTKSPFDHLEIRIPEKTITIGWLSDKGNTREGVVRAYLLRHPELINGLAIENLVATNVWLKNWERGWRREIDLLFEKDGIYYLVETKREGKYAKGDEQLGDIVDCFKSDFKKHQTLYKGFIPVLVTTTNKSDDIETEWF
jgi:hypothetical protein